MQLLDNVASGENDDKKHFCVINEKISCKSTFDIKSSIFSFMKVCFI